MSEGRSWRMWVGAIPGDTIRGNSRAHWRAKGLETKKWVASGYEHVISEMTGRQYVEKVRITFTWHHWRKIDLDNLAIGMKPWVDGLVAGIGDDGFDDDPDHVLYGQHSFVTAKRGDSKTEVLIEEID